jgi:hypothetical protein
MDIVAQRIKMPMTYDDDSVPKKNSRGHSAVLCAIQVQTDCYRDRHRSPSDPAAADAFPFQ